MPASLVGIIVYYPPSRIYSAVRSCVEWLTIPHACMHTWGTVTMIGLSVSRYACLLLLHFEQTRLVYKLSTYHARMRQKLYLTNESVFEEKSQLLTLGAFNAFSLTP